MNVRVVTILACVLLEHAIRTVDTTVAMRDSLSNQSRVEHLYVALLLYDRANTGMIAAVLLVHTRATPSSY
jgi:hypothetical protein